MANISLADATVYNDDVNKPTDGAKLRTDLQTVITESNAKETRLATAENNISTIQTNLGSFTNTIFKNSAYYYLTGFYPEYVSANTIKFNTGYCLDSTHTSIINNFGSTTVSMAVTDAAAGLVDGSDAVSEWVFAYVIADPSALTTASVVFSTVNEFVSGTIDLAWGTYTLKRQLPFAFRNDGSSNIVPFRVLGWETPAPWVLYRDYETVAGFQILSGGVATAFTPMSSGNSQALISPLSGRAKFEFVTNYVSGTGVNSFVRQAGSALTTGVKVGFSNVNFPEYNTFLDMDVNSSQRNLEYKMSASTSNLDCFCLGYQIDLMQVR